MDSITRAPGRPKRSRVCGVGLATLCFLLSIATFEAQPGGSSGEGPTIQSMVEEASLIVVGHFGDSVNERHSVASVVHPMVLWGQFDTNKVLMVKFSATSLTRFVEPEAVWIFFLGEVDSRTPSEVLWPEHTYEIELEAKRSNEDPSTFRYQYHRVLGDGPDYQGIVPGTQENIREAKSMLAKRRQTNIQSALRRQVSAMALVQTLESGASSDSEKAQALHRLGELGSGAKPAIPAFLRLIERAEFSGAVLKALVNLGEEGVEPLLLGLAKSTDLERAAYAAALGQIGPRAGRAVPALSSALADKSAHVRLACAQALGRICSKPETAVPSLITALEDDDAAVRQEAARALGFFGPAASKATDALSRIAKEEGNGVAREALRKIEDPTPR